jgi:hypothetical protein
MANRKSPQRVNDPLRLKLGTVAGILAQSPAVASSFGRWPGFILIMTGMLVILIVSVTAIFVASKGVSHLLNVF